MSTTSSNVTSGFIDLATFDELEKYMYGGQDATAYFVRETRKATWFTQVPVVLSRAAGSPAFDTEWSVSISRAGDYLLNTWLRVTVPAITAVTGASGSTSANAQCRWTRNLMHNLIKEATITFNDLVAARFDNYHLDFWAAFTVPASKREGYDNMIGNMGLELPKYNHEQKTLNLPLPFFFCRDSGVALPTAALPYNDMRLNFSFRKMEDLVIWQPNATASGAVPATSSNVSGMDGKLPLAHVWANYAIVSNDERKRMACAPRDILIEQVQTAPRYTFAPASNSKPSFDIRFSHAIKALFFAVRNTTLPSEWSNYTDRVLTTSAGDLVISGSDPILETSLVYENTNRLTSMGSDYFSLVNPWYHAPAIPTDKGFHMYSYSLDFFSLDPMGSTNYGKLTNVSIQPVATEDAVKLGNTTSAQGSLTVYNQKYEFVVTAVNNNVVRISGGALGFPVL